MQKIWLFAEPETFFLPGVARRLYEENLLEGIIEIRFREPFKKKLVKTYRIFGLTTFFILVLMSIGMKFWQLFVLRRSLSLKGLAQEWGLPFFSFENFNSLIERDRLREIVGQCPIFVQVSRKVPKKLVVDFFLINKHCSLLPRYAGIYPVFWAMLDQTNDQGVTIHRMNEEFDKGPILAQQAIPNRGTFFEIYYDLYLLTSTLLIALLKNSNSVETLGIQPNLEYQSYRSFPSSKDRKEFLRRGLRFGIPKPYF